MLAGNPFRPLDLRLLSKLRCLAFRIGDPDGAHYLSYQWIAYALSNGYIPKTLEELTFIDSPLNNDWYVRGPMKDLCRRLDRVERVLLLDKEERPYPNLRKMRVIVDFEAEEEDIQARVLFWFRDRIAKTGLLSVRRGDEFEVDHLMFSLL
jgi:hypothetical protein